MNMNMKGNYTYEYPRPSVTADCVVFGTDGHELSVLLIERGQEPFKGCWAIPGGFMDMDEDAEACACRELEEETGLTDVHMEQIGAFTEVDRDPRGRTVSIAYLAVIKKTEVKGADDAAQAAWFPIGNLPPLAFDHEKILRAAVESLRGKIHFGPAVSELLPAGFLNVFKQANFSGDRASVAGHRPDNVLLPRRYTPENINFLAENEIFVFGSNLQGLHGGGAARAAVQKFGAVWGQGVGMQGRCYAIPTMHGGVDVIKPYVDDFIMYAKDHPEFTFLVTRIGCGIAGFRDADIAPLFADALNVLNIVLPKTFVEVLSK